MLFENGQREYLARFSDRDCGLSTCIRGMEFLETLQCPSQELTIKCRDN